MSGKSDTDADLVHALAAGQTSALGDIYDRYSDRLYSYAITLLRNPDAAADAVSDTFLLAATRIDQLRDPSRLRPWLYAICRNECSHYHRGATRVTPLADSPEMSDTKVDLEAGLGAAEAASLVAAALPGLNDNDREVIELAMRHDFDAAEIGAAMGLNTNNASARVSRAKGQLHRCLGALVMFRTAGRNCDELKTIIDRSERFDALTRKRIARHIDDCDQCSRVKKSAMLEIAMASALPIAAAPPSLRARVLAQDTVAREAELAASRRSFDNRGWPRPPVRSGRLMLAGAASAAVLLGLLGVGLAAGPVAEDNGQQVMVEATQAPTSPSVGQSAATDTARSTVAEVSAAAAVASAGAASLTTDAGVPGATDTGVAGDPQGSPDDATQQPATGTLPATEAAPDQPSATGPDDTKTPAYPDPSYVPPQVDIPGPQPAPSDFLTAPDPQLDLPSPGNPDLTNGGKKGAGGNSG